MSDSVVLDRAADDTRPWTRVDPGVRFGPYEVHECVGSGGMATVHRATVDLGGGVKREVALKRLLPHLAEDDRFVEDFIREAKLAAHLRHPNIIQIHDLGRIGSDYFIAMELVRGISLMSLMRFASKRNTLLPVGAVLSLMLELTDALDHAHTGTSDAGEPLELVHRDLTPSNLLITDDGHLKVIDFGIAKASRGDLSTDSGVAKGKLGYMALEAIRAEQVDARADLFSAGVVMWELLTGQRLFKPTDWEPLTAREVPIERPSRFNPQCPAELDHLVVRAVAKLRDDRWRSAEEMHRMLAPIARNFAASPAEVMRAKQAIRPETSNEPYAGFELGEVDDDPSLEIVLSSTPRPLDWTGSLWPPEPATEPKLMQRVEGTSSWPIEPATEPKMYTSDMLERARRDDTPFTIEPPSVQVKELPVKFSPTSFDDTAARDIAKTEQVPTLGSDPTRSKEPATEPRKPRPRPPAAKRAPPAPFRSGHSLVRNPAPGTADHLDRPSGKAIAQIAVEPAETFDPEDTVSDRDPFDEE